MTKSKTTIGALSALVLLAAPFAMSAQPEADVEARIKMLEKRVAELEQKLQQQEARNVLPPPNNMLPPPAPPGMPRDPAFDDIFERLRREMQQQGLGGMEIPFGPGGPGGQRGFGAPFGQAPRPRLGVELAPVSPELTERFKNDVKDGAFVMSVVPGSPAEKAGINVGDAISQFNGKPVASPKDLIDAVHAAPAGMNDITVLRRGESLALKVDLRASEEPFDAGIAPDAQQQGGWIRRNGPGLQPRGARGTTQSRTEVKAGALQLNDELAKLLKLSDDQRKKMSDVLDKHSRELNTEYAEKAAPGRHNGWNVVVGGDVNKLIEKHAQAAENELNGTLTNEQLAEWNKYRRTHSSVSISQSTTINNGVTGGVQDNPKDEQDRF